MRLILILGRRGGLSIIRLPGTQALSGLNKK
jgi:hypothetical protein